MAQNLEDAFNRISIDLRLSIATACRISIGVVVGVLHLIIGLFWAWRLLNLGFFKGWCEGITEVHSWAPTIFAALLLLDTLIPALIE